MTSILLLALTSVIPACPPGMAYVHAGPKSQAFCIDRLEITQAEYRQCVRSKQCTSIRKRRTWANQDRYPVVDATQKQALAYCEFRGKRLPSPSEWLQATGLYDDDRMHPWGNSNDHTGTSEVCWGKGNDSKRPCNVGSATVDVSPYGVRDMGGNAREWTWDAKAEYQFAGGDDWESWSIHSAALRAAGFDGIRCAKSP